MVTTERTWCGTSTDHVAHPVGHPPHGFRCQGWGRFHDDMVLESLSDKPCGHTWTGPSGIVWDCTRTEHPSDPSKGYCGSGHNMVARPRVGVS